MSKRRSRMVHGLSVLSVISACTRGTTNLFQFFVRAKAGTQDGARVVEEQKPTKEEWEMLARTQQEYARRNFARIIRLTANSNNRSGGADEPD